MKTVSMCTVNRLHWDSVLFGSNCFLSDFSGVARIWCDGGHNKTWNYLSHTAASELQLLLSQNTNYVWRDDRMKSLSNCAALNWTDKNKLLDVEGARAAVPDSWRHRCLIQYLCVHVEAWSQHVSDTVVHRSLSVVAEYKLMATPLPNRCPCHRENTKFLLTYFKKLHAAARLTVVALYKRVRGQHCVKWYRSTFPQPVWQPCWTNSHCSFNRLSNRVVQPVWQPAV